MSLTPEQIAAANKANLEALVSLTHKAFESIEKLVELNMQAARNTLEQLPRQACDLPREFKFEQVHAQFSRRDAGARDQRVERHRVVAERLEQRVDRGGPTPAWSGGRICRDK